MELPVTENYLQLFLEDVPLLDTRAPVEFSAGAFPMAKNIPLLTDEERHLIGIEYKHSGQQAAIRLGEQLVGKKSKEQRVTDWANFFSQNPDGVLYCFRGGLRSQIAQQWIYEATGNVYPRVYGGYKALRKYLLEQLDRSAKTMKPIILGGHTGAGKTIVLNECINSIDLERIAWHRGSAFGHHVTPQPTQIDFENRLSIALLKHIANNRTHLILEDESKNIGSRHLPPSLYEQMSTAPMVILETTLEERVENSIQEYVYSALKEYQLVYGENEGFVLWSDYLLGSLNKIRKRLGGERYKKIDSILSKAIVHLRKTGDAKLHAGWIKMLLEEYYDPMYDYQIKNKKERIVFSGSRSEVKEYLEQG